MKKIFLTSVFSGVALIVFSQVPEKGKPQLASAEKKDTVATAVNAPAPVLGNSAPSLQNGQAAGKSEQPVAPPVLSESTEPKKKE